jgi:hypothetical protein
MVRPRAAAWHNCGQELRAYGLIHVTTRTSSPPPRTAWSTWPAIINLRHSVLLPPPGPNEAKLQAAPPPPSLIERAGASILGYCRQGSGFSCCAHASLWRNSSGRLGRVKARDRGISRWLAGIQPLMATSMPEWVGARAVWEVKGPESCGLDIQSKSPTEDPDGSD